jgi:RNA polymerase sigma-70 factor (ECF subfamily)
MSTSSMLEVSETVLVAHSKQGNNDAIAELFRRHYSRSLQIASGILRHQDDAQDAVQAAFFQAFRRIESFRGEASFKTWITRIVVNCCLLQLRETRNRVNWVQLADRHGAQGPDILPSRAPTPENSAWCGEIASAFSSAVSRLPEHLHEAYTLLTSSELSLQEAASSLGLTVAATKTRLFRARAAIRTSLQPFRSAGHQV